MKALFWASWAIAAIVTAIFVYFFFVGLADGRVSSLNVVLWIAVLGGVMSVTGGSLWLKRSNRPALATVVAMVLALPGLLAGLFLLTGVGSSSAMELNAARVGKSIISKPLARRSAGTALSTFV